MCANVHIRVCVSARLSNLSYVRALMPLAYQSSDIADNVNFRGPPLNLSPVNLYYKQMLAVLLPPAPHPLSPPPGGEEGKGGWQGRGGGSRVSHSLNHHGRREPS